MIFSYFCSILFSHSGSILNLNWTLKAGFAHWIYYVRCTYAERWCLTAIFVFFFFYSAETRSKSTMPTICWRLLRCIRHFSVCCFSLISYSLSFYFYIFIQCRRCRRCRWRRIDERRFLFFFLADAWLDDIRTYMLCIERAPAHTDRNFGVCMFAPNARLSSGRKNQGPFSSVDTSHSRIISMGCAQRWNRIQQQQQQFIYTRIVCRLTGNFRCLRRNILTYEHFVCVCV